MGYDLKKLEKKFHEMTNVDRYHYMDEIRITEELLEQAKCVYIPFGNMTYFLVIEDGKPVLYIHAVSRMDLDSICFMDEDDCECYDIFDGDNQEMYEKYKAGQRKLKPFDGVMVMPKPVE